MGRHRLLRLAAATAAALAACVLSACGSNRSGPTTSKPITLAQFSSLRLGGPQDQVTKQFGLPDSPQKLVPYGFTHEEPRGQRCIYYSRGFPDAGDPWNRSDTFQLCFEGSRLRRKWAYIASRA